MHKEARKLADQMEFLLPGPQSWQDQLPGMKVKGNVTGL
jgi:hypothetical protein